MKWYTGLFIGEKAYKKIDKIRAKIEEGRRCRNAYLITLPANSENMLDIIPVNLGIMITWREIYVIGIAATKQEAVLLTGEIIKKVYEETNDVKVKEYFSAPEDLFFKT